MGGHAIRPGRYTANLDLFHQSGYADLKKLIHVAAAYAQILQTFQQWDSVILGLRNDAPIELELTEFAVEKLLGSE